MGYKLTWMYVWQQKIRPSGWWGWQPWANTLVYFPFKEDLLDHSWNSVTMTQWWSNLSIVNWVAEFDWWYLYRDGLSSVENFPLTISLWVNADTIASENDIINSNVYSTGFDWWNNIIHNSKLRLECLPWWNQYSASPISVNTRYNIVNVLENWSCKFYVNGSLEGTISWTPNLRDRLCIWATYWFSWDLWSNPFDGKMSQVIIEDIAWSAQEVQDYFTQTKWDYWIS